MSQFRLLVSLALGFALSLSSVTAQWLDYPAPGVPRTADGKPNLSAPAPRTADGRPDLSGVWETERGPASIADLGDPVPLEFLDIGARLQGGLPYKPWAAQLVKTRSVENRISDPTSYGLPIGLVRIHTFPNPRKIIQVPGQLVILSEYNASYRQIFTDGRKLDPDPNPTWNGYSTGKWDGDVLVVQSTGFRDGLWLDGAGNPLTDAAKITERFRRPNFGQLEITITVDDPKAYTKPWTIILRQTLRLDTELMDYIVNENEKDRQHYVK